MNPFDLPPSGAPVSVDGPPAPEPSRRGRTALVVVLTLGLVGGGVAGVSQFASADRPDLAVSAQDEPDDTIAPADDETTDDTTTDDTTDDTTTDGEFVLDLGDGEPIVVDLGDLDLGRIGDLTECVGLPAFDADGGLGEFPPGDWAPGEFPLDLEQLFDDLPLGDLDGLDLEGLDLDGLDLEGLDLDGGSVTVVGPDGVSVVDLGENGSVTVTSEDGAVTVSTEGDATVSDLDDLFGEFGRIFEGGTGLFDDEVLHDEAIGAWPGLESIDPDEIQSCIDEVLGN